MHWSLRMIIDLPSAILTFRRNHRMMNRLSKIEKTEGSIASFREMMTYPKLAQAEHEIYVDMLPEIMEDADSFDTDELEWFLECGEQMGIIQRIEGLAPPPNNDWKSWEEE